MTTSIIGRSESLKALRRKGLNAFQFGDGIIGGTMFEALPAAALAAGSDNLSIIAGTGTELVARDTKGRFNLKSQATTPADNDNIIWTPGNTTNVLNQTITATSLQSATFRFSLNTITACFFSAGWNENITDADPTGTAGDGVGVLFIPAAVATTELTNNTDFDTAAFTTAQRANILLYFKVAGVDTFADTGVVMEAGRLYTVQLIADANRKLAVLIDGKRVGGSPALTNNAALRAFAGCELTATPVAQKDFSLEGFLVHRP